MSSAVLALEDLTAGYDGAAAVRSLDITVGAGEVVALLGANGAGKTTTLRAVSGIVKPIRGGIKFGGDDLTRHSPSARARLGIAPGQRLKIGDATFEITATIAAEPDKLAQGIGFNIGTKLQHLGRIKKDLSKRGGSGRE